MFKIVNFTHGYIAGVQDQCIVFRHLNGTNQVDISFPFIEGMPVISLNTHEAFKLKNAIDELLSPLLLEVPKGAGHEKR